MNKEKSDINFKCESSLGSGARNIIVELVEGSLNIDHNGQFCGPDGSAKTLSSIIFTEDQIDGVDGGEFYAFDAISDVALTKTPYLYLESNDGTVVAFENAKPFIPSHWKMGVIFTDNEGQGWFCGHSDKNADFTSEGGVSHPGYDEADLFRVCLETPGDFAGKYGNLAESLPSEGEFWITEEETPKIISSPWRSGFAEEVQEGDTWPGRSELREREAEILKSLMERVEAVKASEKENESTMSI